MKQHLQKPIEKNLNDLVRERERERNKIYK